MIDTSLYDLLGVEPTASAYELRAAYRRRAKEFHPDRNPGNPAAADLFARLASAYATLRDPALRAEYDRTGNFSEPSAAEIQRNTAKLMRDVLDSIIQSAERPISEIDVVKRMKSLLREGLAKIRDLKVTEERFIRDYEVLLKRIKRKDEKENVFADLITEKLILRRKQAKILQTELEYGDRALTECELYESLPDIIRSVQMGMYAASEGEGWKLVYGGDAQFRMFGMGPGAST